MQKYHTLFVFIFDIVYCILFKALICKFEHLFVTKYIQNLGCDTWHGKSNWFNLLLKKLFFEKRTYIISNTIFGI